jgi:hypothetical protein
MPVIPIALAIANTLISVGVGVGAASAIGFYTATALLAIAVSAVSMGANALIGLTHRSHPPLDPGRQVTIRQPDCPRRVIYGRARIAGVPTFMDLRDFTTGFLGSSTKTYKNVILDLVLTISGHQLQSIDMLYLDGFECPQSGGWGVTSGKYFKSGGGATGGSKVWWETKLGAPGEAAFTHLSADNPRWTKACRQDGCGSMRIGFWWDSDIFPSGIPNPTVDVHGALVYDPRNSTTAYSENAALCVADYLTNTDYGMSVPWAEIDTDALIAAANICDEDVALKAGGTEKRYTCNGMFAVDANPQDILGALAGSMAGYVVRSEGMWHIVAGAYNSPSITLTDDDIRAPISVQTLRSKRDLCNGVKGTYYYPTNKWQQTDVPAQISATALAEDSGFTGDLTPSGTWASGTDYHYTAPPSEARDVVVTKVTNFPAWVNGHNYVLGDEVVQSGALYYCILNHTSATATNKPGTGSSWETDWVLVAADMLNGARVFVCIQSHTASATNQPGVGVNSADYWVEATNLIWKDIALAFTVSPSMAQRIFSIELERIRRQTTATFPCKLSAWQLQPGDVFQYSHPRYGWTNKTFLVLQADLVVDAQGDAPTIGVDLKVMETDAGIYAWDPTTQEQTPGQPDSPNFPAGGIPGTPSAAYGPGMTYTCTDAQIAWTWDYSGSNAIQLTNISQTQYTPTGNQTVTGLVADTSYLFYPFFDLSTETLAFIDTNGTGTPAWAHFESPFAGANKRVWTTAKLYHVGDYVVNRDSGPYVCKVQHTSGSTTEPGYGASWTTDWDDATNALRNLFVEWSLNSHIPLAVRPIAAATATTGNTGGGGGGGDGGCLRLGMMVRDKLKDVIPVESVVPGDRLWGPEGQWLEVIQTRRAAHDLWCTVRFNNGAEVAVTTMHPFTSAADGSIIRACELCLESDIPTPTGIAYPTIIEFHRIMSEKVPITLEAPHTFYASSDGIHWVLTHNMAAPPNQT